jgi:hypothetical protein
MTEIINEYIEMRNERMLNPILFIKYALEKTGVRHQYRDIHTYLQFANHDSIFDKLDKEFNLDILYDKSGKFLKCYPASNQ